MLLKLSLVPLLLPVLVVSDTDTDTGTASTGRFSIHMPNARPREPETYLCTALPLDGSAPTRYVTGFLPQADRKTAHHLLLFGCATPGSRQPVFNCGDMMRGGEGADADTVREPCASGQTVVYAWAQNAPSLELPEGVAFRVGGPESGIEWLVLQVHYASVDHIPPTGDRTGVVLQYTTIPQPMSAGIFLMGTSGYIPPRSTTKMEVACQLEEEKVLHPFAFRVHTHKLGEIVSGWKVQQNDTWTLVGKQSPQVPQMFFPVENKAMTLVPGDKLAARCTMLNQADRLVEVGFTADDEMCNFYLMYWTQGPNLLSRDSCWSPGPPFYTWEGKDDPERGLYGGHLRNIPDEEASSFW